MAVFTAKQLKQKVAPEITIPFEDGEIIVRKPKVATMVFAKLMPMPLLKSAMAAIGEASLERKTEGDDVRTAEEILADLLDGPAGEFMNRWICLVSVHPKVVEHAEEANDEAVWVGDLPMTLKTAIVKQTFELTEGRRAEESASEFRPEPHGVDARPGGETVEREAKSDDWPDGHFVGA